MPIDLTDKIVGLISAMSDADIAALPPAERRRLADYCRGLANRADKAGAVQKAGVLGDLRSGQRQE